MIRRQVACGVADRIRQESDEEAAERLFDDLPKRLDDPTLAEDFQTLPVEQVVRRICRDLGLATAPLAARSPPPFVTRGSPDSEPSSPASRGGACTRGTRITMRATSPAWLS